MPKQSLGVKTKSSVKGRVVMGRPTVYNTVIAQDIVDKVTECYTLYQLCKLPDMPNRDTIYQWLIKYSDFSDKYSKALGIRRSMNFESLLDVIEKEPDVNRARLKVDVIKWQLSKEEPRKYGDKLDVTSDGEKIVPIIQVGINHTKRDVIEAETVPVDDMQKSLSSADYDGPVQNPSEVEPDTPQNIISDINGW